MTETSHTLLPARGAVTIGGPDRMKFLQGLVSNDVQRATATQAVYAALLTPQGKFLHDMFITARDDVFWLDIEAEQVDDLLAKFNKYKLRSDIALANRTADYGVVTAGKAIDGGFLDPRLPKLGWRAILPRALLPAANAAAFAVYERGRLSLGIPEAGRDLIRGETLLLEANFDKLNGVDFSKGCYMGQELTARTHYRALLKKRLFPVRSAHGPCPPQGMLLYDGVTEVGTMRSSLGEIGLALLKTDYADNGNPVSGDGIILTAHKPGWMAAAV